MQRLLLLVMVTAVSLAETDSPGQEAAPAVRRAPGHWPQWHGPDRRNVSRDTDLLREWPQDDGPPLAWASHGLGEGTASVAIADGRVFTTGALGEAEYAVALDERHGGLLWRTEIGPKPRAMTIMRWLSQRTPTVDADRVYVYSHAGELFCLDTKDGQIQWSRDYVRDFQGKSAAWGYCDHPLVDGDRLICTPGGETGTVVALDKRTGDVLWRSLVTSTTSNGPEALRPSHAAMVHADVHGERVLITSLSKGVAGLRARDGKVLWHDHTDGDRSSVYTPIVLSDGVLTLNGWQGTANRFKWATKDGQLDVDLLYSTKVSLGPWHGSAVIIGDQLWALGNAVVRSLNVATGEANRGARIDGWRGRAALTAAEGMLYLRADGAEVFLVEPTAEQFVVRSRFIHPTAKNSVTWAFPVVTGGRLYLRDEDALYVYDVTRSGEHHRETAGRHNQLALPEAAVERAPVDPARRGYDSIFIPTPTDVVDKMLELAGVAKDDLVADLGSGDGRIVITAAKKYGCRSLGWEIDRRLANASIESAKAAGVADQVRIEQQDLFTADLSEVDVVTLYLIPQTLEKLEPQLRQLKRGARVVTHHFPLPGVTPSKTISIDSPEDGFTHKVYLYEAPLVVKKDEREP